MTNKEFAASLRKLAEVYETHPDFKQIILSMHQYDKEGAADVVRTIGGKWTKEDAYSDYIDIRSNAIPGFYVSLPRNKMCRRLNPEWECTPLLSPEEEAEVFEGGK